MWIVDVMLSDRIVCNVSKLVVKIIATRNSVCVIARLPYFSRIEFTNGDGEAPFDELSRLLDGFNRSDQNVQMVRHHDKTVGQEAFEVAMAQERGNHQFGDFGALEDASALMGHGG